MLEKVYRVSIKINGSDVNVTCKVRARRGRRGLETERPSKNLV